MTETLQRERSPGFKLLIAGLVAAVLIVPLLLVYALVYDRQEQSQTAQNSIAAGWGGAQIVAGPIVVVPFRTVQTQNEVVDGRSISRAVEVEKLLYISPVENRARTVIEPEELRKSIYSSVLYEAQTRGTARFELPEDLGRFGVDRERLIWDRAELRMGASDARGLTRGGTLVAEDEPLAVQLPWQGEGSLTVTYSFGLRGSGSLSLVPRGGQTAWQVSSTWASPSFGGAFLPETRAISGDGFAASYTVDKLALGQPPVAMEDIGPPSLVDAGIDYRRAPAVEPMRPSSVGPAGAAETVGARPGPSPSAWSSRSISIPRSTGR
jgi:inner membrane protein